jgi:hypothetical protein
MEADDIDDDCDVVNEKDLREREREGGGRERGKTTHKLVNKQIRLTR